MKTHKLEYTEDLSIFEMHEFNRNLHENPILTQSMRENGFMPSCALHCIRNGNGKLKVVRGHHRLDTAKRLKIGVYYIVDECCSDIFFLEGGCGQNWSVTDFAFARAKSGDRHCAAVLEFQKQHGLTLGSAASLVGGEGASSANKVKLIKSGAFKVSSNNSHANDVVRITDMCRDLGVTFATAAGFVAAVSVAVRVKAFDIDAFCHKLRLYSANMRARTRWTDYLDEIEAIYNYGAKGRRLPIKFQAMENARERQATFGRSGK